MIARGPILLLCAAALAATATPSVAARPAQGVSAIQRASAHELARYGAVIAKLDAQLWDEARSAILALPETDSMRAHLLAQLYLAKGSPRVELFDLLDLLHKAPQLHQAERLAALAKTRGAQIDRKSVV